MNIHESAAVMTADNEKVGHVDRVVIDPRTREVTHIVVKEGFLFPEDTVIPYIFVETANEDNLHLSINEDQLDAFPPFEDIHYVPVDESIQESEELYWYPPLRGAYWNQGGYMGYPGTFIQAKPKFVTRTVRNVPEDTVVLDEGTDVYSADSEHIGTIEEIYTAPDGWVTHILVSKGLLFEEETVIPSTWIDIADEEAIRLLLPEDALSRLPQPTG